MRRLPVLSLLLTLVLAACGGSVSPTTTAGATTTTSSSLTPSGPTTTATSAATTTTAVATTTSKPAEVPRIKVEDGVKTEGLDTISVRVGETVSFEVEVDVADEIHVHGCDLLFETIPEEEEVLVEFVADPTGIFEVELEGLGLTIVDIEVTP